MKGLRWFRVIGLIVVWVMLWGEVTPFIVAGGVVVSVLVLLIFPPSSVWWPTTVRPWPALVLLVRFLYDLVRASITVAWLAVWPKPLPRSAVIGIDLHTDSELLMTITAELVCLVPGTLLIDLDADRRRMWLHVLDASDLDKVRAETFEQERRVVEALAVRPDLDAYRTEVEAR